MKKFVIALAAVMLAASPALAKKYHKPVATDPAYQAADQAYAYVPDATSSIGSRHSDAVYAAGQYLGADPDPFIRQQLMRDPSSNLQ
jgi:opacity protein-like surface antigen